MLERFLFFCKSKTPEMSQNRHLTAMLSCTEASFYWLTTNTKTYKVGSTINWFFILSHRDVDKLVYKQLKWWKHDTFIMTFRSQFRFHSDRAICLSSIKRHCCSFVLFFIFSAIVLNIGQFPEHCDKQRGIKGRMLKWSVRWIKNREQKLVLLSIMVQWLDVLGHEEVVHFLQLLLWQHKAVDLLLSRSTRNGYTTHKHCSSLLLFLGLVDMYVTWVKTCKKRRNMALLCNTGFTLTKEDTGKVAKSEEALAPGWYETTCSATSPWNKNL